MPRMFGTDGVRGLANRQVTADLALHLSRAAVAVLAPSDEGSGRARVIVGRDSRASGEFLSAAVLAGVASAGADAIDVGVIPTPAVAFLTADRDADFGIVLSASHNPMPDNGIKLFARGGGKLPDAVEDEIEAQLAEIGQTGPVGADVGRLLPVSAAEADYIDHLVATVPAGLAGLKVVVDGANGAASTVSPAAMRQLGAEVTAINCDPDGYNINRDCGSTHLESLIAKVVETGADVGIAHDGDADRCLAVDELGNVIDGDHIMAILALDMKSRGELAKDTVVVTVMTNLGFKQAMQGNDISVEETGVGDRYVLERMLSGDYNLGGEQSGHVLLRDFATTGDGTLTGLHLLSAVKSAGRPLSELASVMTRLPQTLVNVPNVDKHRLGDANNVMAAVAVAEDALGGSGRVLLRPSGTEPLIRVMVEAADAATADQVAHSLAEVVAAELSL